MFLLVRSVFTFLRFIPRLWQPPKDLLRTPWRAVQHAVNLDQAALTFGAHLPGMLLLAHDAQTRQTMERLYQAMMTDPEDA